MSPLPVLAEVLSMTEAGRLRPAAALAAGYAVALGAIAAASVALGSQMTGSTSTSRATAVLDLVAGGLLVLVAGRTWHRSRKAPGAGLPSWIARVGSMSTLFAFALGAFLPPYVVALAAGNEIVRQGLSGTTAWAQAVVFVVVACLGVVTPLVVVAASPSGADARLASWKGWLERHWQTVAALILVVAGIYLLAKGVHELGQVG